MGVYQFGATHFDFHCNLQNFYCMDAINVDFIQTTRIQQTRKYTAIEKLRVNMLQKMCDGHEEIKKKKV